MEGWKVGRLEGWKIGRLEDWRLDSWNGGRLEEWKGEVGRMEEGREEWKMFGLGS